MSSSAPPSPPETPRQPLGLGPWNLYFLLKFGLYWRELIGFHPLENLAFALALLVPLATPRLRRLRAALAIPLGIALLYYDSWLPPIRRALAQADLLANFSAGYLLELAGRFVSIPIVALLVALGAGYLILARWLRFSPLVLGALAVLAVQGQSGAPALATVEQAASGNARIDPSAELKAFFAREAGRKVSFKPAAADAPPFDVIFIHICSLSWDDLKATGLDSHPLWRRFDFLFTRFNSAASYSGPAVIRIQRATCGQQAHDDLYNPVAGNCYLMGSLQQAGFEPMLALNHDGHFDDFLRFIQAQSGMQAPPLPLTGVKAPLRAFDDSPIYDDRDVLNHWLEARASHPAARAALFYNSVSLHDGNRYAGEKTGRSSLETYRPRLQKLLDDLEAFMDSLEKSGRRAVVALVPEHGAALRGDKMQIAGLREIPSPAITLVPVGIRVVGQDARRQGEPVRIDAPTSYLAMSDLVSRLLARSPYGAGGFTPADYTADLPTTPLVSQNGDVVMMEIGNRFFMKMGKESWSDYKVEP